MDVSQRGVRCLCVGFGVRIVSSALMVAASLTRLLPGGRLHSVDVVATPSSACLPLSVCAAALHSLLQEKHSDLTKLPEKALFQMNDTHPTIAGAWSNLSHPLHLRSCLPAISPAAALGTPASG